jgi:hypothetical protein
LQKGIVALIAGISSHIHHQIIETVLACGIELGITPCLLHILPSSFGILITPVTIVSRCKEETQVRILLVLVYVFHNLSSTNSENLVLQFIHVIWWYQFLFTMFHAKIVTLPPSIYRLYYHLNYSDTPCWC